MQARTSSVGRGGISLRGTWHRMKQGWHTGPLTDTWVSADVAGATTQALEQAHREIARQSQLLATLTAETERVRAEAEALAQFRARTLAAIGHELRTPLNAVIGFSEAMQCELHGPLGNPRYRDYAEHIRQSGVQLLQAAELVLDVSRTVAYVADTTPRRGAEASGATLHTPAG